MHISFIYLEPLRYIIRLCVKKARSTW